MGWDGKGGDGKGKGERGRGNGNFATRRDGGFSTEVRVRGLWWLSPREDDEDG